MARKRVVKLKPKIVAPGVEDFKLSSCWGLYTQVCHDYDDMYFEPYRKKYLDFLNGEYRKILQDYIDKHIMPFSDTLLKFNCLKSEERAYIKFKDKNVSFDDYPGLVFKDPIVTILGTIPILSSDEKLYEASLYLRKLKEDLDRKYQETSSKFYELVPSSSLMSELMTILPELQDHFAAYIKLYKEQKEREVGTRGCVSEDTVKRIIGD